MEIIAYILLAALIISVLLLFWCGSELIKSNKQNPNNIVFPSEEDITFPMAMTKWGMNHALRQAIKTDKEMSNKRRKYHRVVS